MQDAGPGGVLNFTLLARKLQPEPLTLISTPHCCRDHTLSWAKAVFVAAFANFCSNTPTLHSTTRCRGQVNAARGKVQPLARGAFRWHLGGQIQAKGEGRGAKL